MKTKAFLSIGTAGLIATSILTCWSVLAQTNTPNNTVGPCPAPGAAATASVNPQTSALPISVPSPFAVPSVAAPGVFTAGATASASPTAGASPGSAAQCITIPIPQGAVGMGPAAYGPNPQIIPPNTTVTWVNNDTVAHTVTADDGSFDSGTLQPGQSFSRTFSQSVTGTIHYHCSIHGAASMSGALQISAAGTASPSPSPSASPGAQAGAASPMSGGSY